MVHLIRDETQIIIKAANTNKLYYNLHNVSHLKLTPPCLQGSKSPFEKKMLEAVNISTGKQMTSNTTLL